MKNIMLVTLLAFTPFAVHAELNLAEPEVLLQQAAQNKNQLRDVINELDQNLAEMRDARSFDKYFSMLDQLQVLSDELKLNTIYPDAVKKLGGRMVQKGVNWLNVTKDSKEKILYYHRWMIEPQPAFAFMYSVDLQIKTEKTYEGLKVGAENLEAALKFVDTKWPSENSLRILYRNTLSEISIKIIKTSNLSEEEILFWLSKIYNPNSMSEVVVDLQNRLYTLTAENKSDLHLVLRRLVTIHGLVTSETFAAPDNLLSQIGDSAVDLIVKSFRFQEKLSDSEFKAALNMMLKRHFAALAAAWTTLDKGLSTEFARYYVQRAFQFIQALKEAGLSTESENLSRTVTERAATVMAEFHNIEGLWTMKDAQGKKWSLNVIFANDNYLYANFSQEGGISLPLYQVVYDMNMGGFIATHRGVGPSMIANIPVRFIPNEDGSLRVVYMYPNKGVLDMKATKAQEYPNLLWEKEEPGADLNGVYEGSLTIDNGKPKKVRLSITVINKEAIATLQYPSVMATFNYGSDATGGVVYLTRGNDSVLGYWMHLRLKLDSKGNLEGYIIMGDRGLMPTKVQLKKVFSVQN